MAEEGTRGGSTDLAYGFYTGVRRTFFGAENPRWFRLGAGSVIKICREMVQKGERCKTPEHDREFTRMELRGLPFLYLFFTTMVFVGGVDGVRRNWVEFSGAGEMQSAKSRSKEMVRISPI